MAETHRPYRSKQRMAFFSTLLFGALMVLGLAVFPQQSVHAAATDQQLIQAAEDKVAKWLESSGVFAAQVRFALSKGHQLTNAKGSDGALGAKADYFHFHPIFVTSKGKRQGTFLGVLGHAHEYDGLRTIKPNNFNIWTGVDLSSEYVATPGPNGKDGLGREDLEKFLRNKGLLRKNESTGMLQVNFRCLEEDKKCAADERTITVKLADGTEKTLCYQIHLLGIYFAKMILTNEEQRQAGQEQVEEEKSNKGGKK